MSREGIKKLEHPLARSHEVRCTTCGMRASVPLEECAGLAVGDRVYVDPENARVGRCTKCSRRTLVVTKVPEPLRQPALQGFWRMPE